MTAHEPRPRPLFGYVDDLPPVGTRSTCRTCGDGCTIVRWQATGRRWRHDERLTFGRDQLTPADAQSAPAWPSLADFSAAQWRETRRRLTRP